MSDVSGRSRPGDAQPVRSRSHFRLVKDLLVLDVEPALLHATAGWQPRDCAEVDASEPFCARIDVLHGPESASAGLEKTKPSLTLNGVPLWLFGDTGVLHRPGSAVQGELNLSTARAEIRVASREDEIPERDFARDHAAEVFDVHQMLLICSAFLLQRQGAAIIHAAAVIPSGDHAWLLVGDSHAGKSTTSLNLIRSGWNYLSDDQVVLTPAHDNAIAAVGWQRAFHLDDGWSKGTTAGRRSEVDPAAFGPGMRRPSARVAGVVTLKLEPDQPTSLTALPSTEALALIVRQSPWFLADRVAAERGLALLSRVALMPSYSLRLGSDVYRDTERLLHVLAPIAGAPE